MSHTTAALATTSLSTTTSPPATTADRLRAEAQKAEASGDNNLVRTVTIGSKEYYVVNITGGKLSDLGAIGTQASKVDELFKSAVTAHGGDFTYMDAQGAHQADGSVVLHSKADLGKTPNAHFEKATDGGFQKDAPFITGNQGGMLKLYEAILGNSGSQIDQSALKSLTKDLSLPKEVQQVVEKHTSTAAPIPTAALIKDLEEAHATYGLRLFNETHEGISPDKATAKATYESAKPTGTALATIKSKVDKRGAPTKVNTLAEQFAVHNVAARSVRTAQHTWNALAKIVDTTVQSHSFPDLRGLAFVSKESTTALPPKQFMRPRGATLLVKDPMVTDLTPLTAHSLLASISHDDGDKLPHSSKAHTLLTARKDDVGLGKLDLSDLDTSPSASLSPTPLASGFATPKMKASSPDGASHAKVELDLGALSTKREALEKDRAEEESVAQSSSIINSGNAKTVGVGVLTGVGALGLGLTAGPALALGAATMATVKGVQYFRGSPTPEVESGVVDDGSGKKLVE